VIYPEADDEDRVSHHNVFGLGLRPEDREEAEVGPPTVRRLFLSWLGTRTDPKPLHWGMNLALHFHLAEVVPLARRKAADATLAPSARGFALLAVGHFGTPADLPVLEKAFADSRVFYTTKDTTKDGKLRPVEVQVSDTAVAAALRLAGQHPADFGFTFLERHKLRGPDTLLKYHLLGFFDEDARQAAHKKAATWLDEHQDDKVRRTEVKDWQALFDGKTTRHWKTEGQVSVEGGLLKIGGDKGGSLVTSARFARGLVRWSFRQAGEARATMTWRGEERRLGTTRQGWTTEEYEPAAAGESPIRLVAPPGTTLLIRDFAFRPY
jgi:hypothetical protein